MFNFFDHSKSPLDIKLYTINKMSIGDLLTLSETDKLHWELAIFSLFKRRGPEACKWQLQLMAAFFYDGCYGDTPLSRRMDNLFNRFHHYEKKALFYLLDNALKDPAGNAEHKIYCLSLMKHLIDDEQVKNNVQNKSLDHINRLKNTNNFKNSEKYLSALIANHEEQLLEDLDTRYTKYFEMITKYFTIYPGEISLSLLKDYNSHGLNKQVVKNFFNKILDIHNPYQLEILSDDFLDEEIILRPNHLYVYKTKSHWTSRFTDSILHSLNIVEKEKLYWLKTTSRDDVEIFEVLNKNEFINYCFLDRDNNKCEGVLSYKEIFDTNVNDYDGPPTDEWINRIKDFVRKFDNIDNENIETFNALIHEIQITISKKHLMVSEELQNIFADIEILLTADVNSESFIEKIVLFIEHPNHEYMAAAFKVLSKRSKQNKYSHLTLERIFLPIIEHDIIGNGDELRLMMAVDCISCISSQQSLSDALILHVLNLLQREDVEPYFKDHGINSHDNCFSFDSIFHSITNMFCSYAHHKKDKKQPFSYDFELSLLGLFGSENFHISFHSVQFFLNNCNLELPLPEKLFEGINNWLDNNKYSYKFFENLYFTDEDNLTLAFSLLNKILIHQPIAESTVNKIIKLSENPSSYYKRNCQSILWKNSSYFEVNEVVINNILQLMQSDNLDDKHKALDFISVKYNSIVKDYVTQIFNFLISCMKLDTSYGEENYYLQEKAYKILMKNNFDNAIDDHLLKLILASLRSMYKNHEFRYSWSDSSLSKKILKNIDMNRSISLEYIRSLRVSRDDRGNVYLYTGTELSILGAVLNSLMLLEKKAEEIEQLIRDFYVDFIDLLVKDDPRREDFLDSAQQEVFDILIHLPEQLYIDIPEERKNEKYKLLYYIRETAEELRHVFENNYTEKFSPGNR